MNPGLVEGLTGNKSNSDNSELDMMVQRISSENQDLRLTIIDLQTKLEEYRYQEKFEAGKVSEEISDEDVNKETKVEEKKEYLEKRRQNLNFKQLPHLNPRLKPTCALKFLLSKGLKTVRLSVRANSCRGPQI